MRNRIAKIAGFSVGFVSLLLVILLGALVVASGKQYPDMIGYRLVGVGIFGTFIGAMFAPGLGVLVAEKMTHTIIMPTDRS